MDSSSGVAWFRPVIVMFLILRSLSVGTASICIHTSCGIPPYIARNIPNNKHRSLPLRYHQLVTRTPISVRGGSLIVDNDDEEEEETEIEEDYDSDLDEDEENLVTPVVKATQKSAKVQVAQVMEKTKPIKIKKRSRQSPLLKLPYILRALLNPFTVMSMTKAYFASLFNINYMQDEVSTVFLSRRLHSLFLPIFLSSVPSLNVSRFHFSMCSLYFYNRTHPKIFDQLFLQRQKKEVDQAQNQNEHLDQGRRRLCMICLN